MIQFTREEQAVLQEKIKSRPDILDSLKKSCEPFFEYGLHIPRGTQATWIMDYECPNDSAKLIYRYGEPDRYECPICHQVFSGMPYSGAWWSDAARTSSPFPTTTAATTACSPPPKQKSRPGRLRM